MSIRFLLFGDRGVIQFLIYTDWLPSWVKTEGGIAGARWVNVRDDRPIANLFPMAADFGYHWESPRYEDQGSMKCDLLPSGECFYDGSGLAAEQLLALLITEGTEAVWRKMEARYESMAAEEVA